MLTTTFIKPQTMEINLPVKQNDPTVKQQDAPAVKASTTLSVIIGEFNKVYWFRGLPTEPLDGPKVTDFSKEGIRNVLLYWNAKLKVGGKEEMVVLIKATDDAIYKNAVDILDEMNICNIKRYALVDLSPEDKEVIKGL
jgi:biopolymer transport protein ExbD